MKRSFPLSFLNDMVFYLTLTINPNDTRNLFIFEPLQAIQENQERNENPHE